jgi:hypothetical protein
MPEPDTLQLERGPTSPSLGPPAAGLVATPDRRGLRDQRSGRQPMDATGPRWRRAGVAPSAATWRPAPAGPRAARASARAVAAWSLSIVGLYCTLVVGNRAQVSAIVPSRWSPSKRFRILPANRTQRDGREENGSHGSTRVMTISANHLEPECHSAGHGPAPADHSPVSVVGRDAGPARHTVTACGGVARVDGHDVGTAPTTANSVLGGTLPRGGDAPPRPGRGGHR